MDRALFKSALIRAVRTFVQAFLAVYGAPQLLGWAAGSQPLDVSLLRAAAAAGIAAVLAFLWRQFLDPSGVPSLVDDNPPAVTDLTSLR